VQRAEAETEIGAGYGTTGDGSENGWLQTPAMFGARLREEPPERLELPDGVTLSGASLAAFLESAHFPFGRYRVGEEQFFVTPSEQLAPAALEAHVRAGPGQKRVGPDLLLWRRASFHVAAGTTSDERDARPFVSPSGLRAYLWLGRPLPDGPLLLRDANNVEERVPLPDDDTELTTEKPKHSEQPAGSLRSGVGVGGSAPTPTPTRCAASPARHPLLELAEHALRQGEDQDVAERHLRAVMRSPRTGGTALAEAGRLWQAMGRMDAAAAAFVAALEHGCVEGALGLSRLAEATGGGFAAETSPLDAAIARNLRSPELHARYADLLERSGQDLQAEWHRRRMEEIRRDVPRGT
jgi:hypothetical protein